MRFARHRRTREQPKWRQLQRASAALYRGRLALLTHKYGRLVQPVPFERRSRTSRRSRHCMSPQPAGFYSKDLIALSNDQDDARGGQLHQLSALFPERLYVAIQDLAKAFTLSNPAHKLAQPTVITHPVYYLHPNQATLQCILTALRLNQRPDAFQRLFCEHGRDGRTLKDFPEALAATEEIVARCKFDLPLGVRPLCKGQNVECCNSQSTSPDFFCKRSRIYLAARDYPTRHSHAPP